MSESFRVAKNCLGLTLPNGQKVNPNRRGLVTVPDRFVADVRRSGHLGDGSIVRSGTGFGSVAGKECPGCGTDIFAWQKSCRGCGGEEQIH